MNWQMAQTYKRTLEADFRIEGLHTIKEIKVVNITDDPNNYYLSVNLKDSRGHFGTKTLEGFDYSLYLKRRMLVFDGAKAARVIDIVC